MTQHFIVIGNPIAHSKSPEIHTLFAAQVGIDISYQRQYCPDNDASFTAVIEAFFHGGGVGASEGNRIVGGLLVRGGGSLCARKTERERERVSVWERERETHR